MNKVVTVAFAALAALGASGCTQGAKASADAAKIEESIRAQEAQWQKDYADKNLEAIVGHYADDAVFANAGEPLVTSDTDRRKAVATLISDPNLKLSFAPDRIEAAQSGELAYARGHYSITVTDKATNKAATSTGSFVTLWKMQRDGSWKAVEDFITPGPAPAETAAK